MKRRGCFVTGTDTGVGKTWLAGGLLAALRRRGLRTAAMKPVASGSIPTPEGPRNEDALLLIQQMTAALRYEDVNPYLFEPPIAPHIAAAADGVVIDIGHIRACLERALSRADVVVVEGVGGWRVPLNAGETVADLAAALDLPVILVVGIRLGCLNHALLSAEAIHRSGVRLAGWIANLIDPGCRHIEDNIEALRRRIAAPLAGVIPHLAAFDAHRIATRLDLDALAGLHG